MILSRLLFPEKCILCGKILCGGEIDLCRSCRMEAPECPVQKQKRSFLDSWVAIWYYKGYIRSSILRYKFHRCRHYAHGYGRMLAMKLQWEYPEGFDLLTWIPISPLRRLRRGYDQVQLLAQAVGKELGMEVTPTLKKIRHNKPQSGIAGQAQRRANVLGVYQAMEADRFRGKRVLLLDDIVTTGSTLSEAARILLTAGAAQVNGAAVAAAANQHKKTQ